MSQPISKKAKKNRVLLKQLSAIAIMRTWDFSVALILHSTLRLQMVLGLERDHILIYVFCNN